MNTKNVVVSVILICLFAPQAECQDTFHNLDFESADLSVIPAGQGGGLVSIGAALPGWTASLGGTAVTQVYQNLISTGSASIDILGPDWNSVPGIIDGNYSVALQWGYGPGLVEENASLSQDGTIPANAKSLEFTAWTFLGPTPLSVSFAGDSLSLFVQSSGVAPSGQPYNVYAANIAAYANQTGELEFTAPFSNVGGVGGIELDDISFSPMAVTPEPDPLVLTGIGGLLFALYRRFAPKRQ